jgi:hypothetical protein
MAIQYRYRHAMGAEDAQRAIVYDELYQRTNDGHMIGWQPGMWFPMMAREEGVSRNMAGDLAVRLDVWMGLFMMKNQAKWETRNAE